MDYSISVGIENYLELNRTLYSENDATEFNRIMKDIYHVEKSFLFLGNNATYMNIKSEFESLVKLLTINDRLFFFFAGHGQNHYGAPYLSAWDSKDNNIGGTWHNLLELMGIIDGSGCKKAIFFIDACESTINFELRNASKSEFAPIGNEELAKFINVEYTYVFSSASHKEKASINNNTKHGIWSTFLFKALSGSEILSLNLSGILTNNTLQKYLNDKVSHYCSKTSHRQRSFGWGKYEREFQIFNFSKNINYNIVPISKMYFGEVDAIAELKNQRTNIESNFYDLNNITKVIMENKNIQIVLGRKGTGKTYIGKYIEDKYKNQVFFIDFENFNYNNFNSLRIIKCKGYERYQEPWEWLLFSYLFEILSKKLAGDFEEIYNELFQGRMTLGKVLNKKLKKGVRISDKYVAMLRVDGNNISISDCVSLYKLILEKCKINESIILILDGLDEKINETDYYMDVMTSLLMTVRYLNNEFYNLCLNIKIVILFRYDVFDLVYGANMGKIESSCCVELQWVSNSSNKSDYPLREFIEKRINNSMVLNNQQSLNSPLACILPKRMNMGRSSEKDSWDWILDFTTYKPRDLIAFFNSCYDLCKNNETCFSEIILWDATKDYSNYLKKEFEDELYGFLTHEQIKEIFDLVLPKMKMNWVNYDTLRGYINSTQSNKNCDEHKIIEYIYRTGIIGIFLDEKEQWSYRQKKISLTRNDMVRSKYKVHIGLWKVLLIW